MKRCFWVYLAIVSGLITPVPVLAGSATSAFKVGLVIGMPTTQKAKAGTARPRYTCGAAAQVLKTVGYRKLSPVNCKGNRFVFTAMMNNRTQTLSVNAFSGKYQISKIRQ